MLRPYTSAPPADGELPRTGGASAESRTIEPIMARWGSDRQSARRACQYPNILGSVTAPVRPLCPPTAPRGPRRPSGRTAPREPWRSSPTAAAGASMAWWSGSSRRRAQAGLSSPAAASPPPCVPWSANRSAAPASSRSSRTEPRRGSVPCGKYRPKRPAGTIVPAFAVCCTNATGSGPPHPPRPECPHRPSSRVLRVPGNSKPLAVGIRFIGGTIRLTAPLWTPKKGGPITPFMGPCLPKSPEFIMEIGPRKRQGGAVSWSHGPHDIRIIGLARYVLFIKEGLSTVRGIGFRFFAGFPFRFPARNARGYEESARPFDRRAARAVVGLWWGRYCNGRQLDTGRTSPGQGAGSAMAW